MNPPNALILTETTTLIQKDFEVENIPHDVSEKELIDFLSQKIREWLDHNMEHLFYILYRLDIEETKVHLALSPNCPTPPHEALALLIWQREKQKAITRLAYKNKQEEEGDGWAS